MVHGAVGDDVFDVAGVVDVGQRIGIEQDQVGSLALLDRSQFFVEAHDTGRNDGGGLDCFHGSESSLDVELEDG